MTSGLDTTHEGADTDSVLDSPCAEMPASYESARGGIESAEYALETSAYQSGGYKGRDLREFRALYEGEFVEPLSRPYPVARFDDPDRVVRTVNPRFEDLSGRYDVNCADCARAVERTWRGAHEEAAGRLALVNESGVAYDGELPSQTEEWAAERFVAVPDPESLRARLEEGGHGSSAIVHTQFSIDGERAAHAYNVVNYHGDVRVLDGQTGETFAWARNRIYDLGAGQSHIALGWNGRGERLTW